MKFSFEGGPRKVEHRWSQDKNMFEYWRDGRTGYIVASTNVCVAIFFSFQHVLLYVHGHMEMERVLFWYLLH